MGGFRFWGALLYMTLGTGSWAGYPQLLATFSESITKNPSQIKRFFVVIGQVEHNYYREVIAMFFIFLHNISMRRYNLVLP
jgi:hypothetical protein